MSVRRESDQQLGAVLARAEGKLPPGTTAAVAVVCGGEVVRAQVLGRREHASGAPITTRSRFAACSITKTVTTALVLRLCEDGVLDLDGRLVDEESLSPVAAGRGGAGADLTVRDLLSHRTGLPPHDLLWLLRRFSAAELPRMLGGFEAIPGGFRKVFAYNNLAFAALGVMIEARTGKSFNTLVEERFLRPLGMGDSALGLAPAAENDFVAPGGLPFRDLGHVAPAGALAASVDDLAKWMVFELRRGVAPDGTRLLPERAFDEMHRPHVALGNPWPVFMMGWEWTGSNVSCGLGHFLGAFHGDKVVFHPGLVDGYSAAFALLPDRGAGAVILSSAHGTPLPAQLAGDVLAVLGGHPAADRAAPGAPPPAPAARAPEPPAVAEGLEGLAGKYRNGAYGDLEVLIEAGAPVLHFGEHRWRARVTSAGTGTFDIPVMGLAFPMRFDVERDSTGVRGLRMPFALDPRVGPLLFERA